MSTVTKNVPMPLYGMDNELNIISMLCFIMEDFAEITTDAERQRIAAWFSDRYGKETPQ